MDNAAPTAIPRPPMIRRTLRLMPHLYSPICKARLYYSRSIVAAAERQLFKQNQFLFNMNDSETQHWEELRRQGYTVLHDFFDPELMDALFERADHLFYDLKISTIPIYKGPSNLTSLEGLTYDELSSTQKVIKLNAPMLDLPEYVDMVFNTSLLKIIVNFLGYIPPKYGGEIVRDFPHNRPLESSNFHKDNDEADCIQIFIYLQDIDDTRGVQVYIPGSHRYDVRSCKPQLSRDLGIAGYDGRLSDDEVRKYYPENTWAVIRAKRGSVGIIYGNGIHKGPWWPHMGDPKNKPRTACRIDVQGYKRQHEKFRKTNQMARADFERLNKLQRLFTASYEVID